MKEKTNKKFIYLIITIIICLLVFVLIYNLTNKNLNNNTNEDNNYINENLSEDEKIVETVYVNAMDYFETKNAYCGFIDKKRTYPGNDKVPNGYFASRTYLSINELESELLQVITKDYLTNLGFYNNYIEENDTLYCANFGEKDEYDDIVFKITNVQKEDDNNMTADISSTIKNGDTTLDEKNIKITLIKDENKWKINNYQVTK